MPRRLIQDHAEVCNGIAVKAQKVKADSQDTAAVTSESNSTQASPQAAQPSLQKDTDQHVPAHTQSTASKSNNALSFLMAEQRERCQVFIFFLEHKPDSTWQAYWFSKGTKAATRHTNSASTSAAQQVTHSMANAALPTSQPVWTATTQMSSATLQAINAPAVSAGKSKVTVQLHTNAASGAEGDLDQLASPQGAASFKGSPSLLKSALQKNVRLCRAAPAVRCGYFQPKKKARITHLHAENHMLMLNTDLSQAANSRTQTMMH